jgi:glycosyltransferase involved in cell wall biosynthesis
MNDFIILDKKFSTTKCLITDQPVIESTSIDKFESVLFLPETEGRKGEGGLRTKGYFKKSYKNKPLSSIVTVVFNGEKYLEQTIQSVINQSYDNVEYIIIDGGSNDGTVDIIKKYEGQIDYWVSEKDMGIYDAMNKGICLAQGKIIGLINADDYYENNIFEDIVKTYHASKSDIIFGDCTTIAINDVMKPNESLPQCMKYPSLLCTPRWIWFGMIFNHPASFICRDSYKKFGLYDESYKIAADYDLLLRMYRQGGTFKKIEKNLAYFREGGISTQLEHTKILRKEMKKIWLNHSKIIGILIIIIKELLILRRSILGKRD